MDRFPTEHDVPDAPDFAALFTVCADSLDESTDEVPADAELWASNHMTPLKASRLWKQCHLLYREAIMDIALFGERPYAPPNPDENHHYLEKREWAVLWALPSRTWAATSEWRNRFAQTFLYLADDLAAGRDPQPSNYAEALALGMVDAWSKDRDRYFDHEDDDGWDLHDPFVQVGFDLVSGLDYPTNSPLAPNANSASVADPGGLSGAPASIEDWFEPTGPARPPRPEPFIERRLRDDEGITDWVSMFPVCPCGDWEECVRCGGAQLTPRTALALVLASELLSDEAIEDMEAYGDEAVEEGWALFSRYPQITWFQDRRWREKAAEAFSDLGEDLMRGEWPLPQTPAEEMALHLMVNELPYVQELLSDVLDPLPAHPLDYDKNHLRDSLFQDEDILMLFDMPHIANPQDPLNQNLYMGDMRPNSWFKPFGQFQPRPRAARDDSNVVPFLRQ